ncbi:MAG: (2Fe-2S)-binding protein [Candidatus Omnitrophica bacterium]|nr:(2Fe-2S)-binding protein [Candidatus Omnitrophota bacterium]
MPTLTIDGKSVTVPEGTTVIQAAEKLGIDVPRYCYHPGLSIAGNCRICLVEVEKNPKLQIACNLPAAEGMAVQTQNSKVNQGRESVLEFLLANHPLDCPVCDQSGECDLQNFYMRYGLYDARFEERKVKKAKAVPLGPTVMLDAERCILCSRCERFTDEISKTGEFGIFNRGDRAEIGLYPGKKLDNKYSGNVVDICPVGALTDRDFRFKARVWYLSSAPSVCNGCSRGCNVDVHYVLDRPHLAGGARVMRLKPRYSAEVNQWWMCDEGRYGYKFIDQSRLRKVLHKGVETPWEAALTELSNGLSGARSEGKQSSVAVLASAQLTTEELFLIRKLFKEALGISQVTADLPKQPGYHDSFLIQADKNPNSAGAALLGLTGSGPQGSDLIERALSGEISALWVFGHDLVKLFGEEKVKGLSEKLCQFIFQGPNENGTSRHAHWVLPSAVYLEKDGTFVNCQGRVQRIGRVFDPLKESREDWRILLELAQLLKLPLAHHSPEEIFSGMSKEIPAFAGMTYEKLGRQGLPAGRQGAVIQR